MKGTIESITDEAAGIKRIVLTTEKTLAHRAGQYIMIALAELPATRRPFSIVELTDKTVTIIVKQYGDFTKTLCACQAGQEVDIYGPYGHFTLPDHDEPIVFIAGGIGITPLYAMIQEYRATNRKSPVALFYSSRTAQDMALKTSLDTISEPSISIHLLHTETPGAAQITAALILSQFPPFAASHFYLCGPVPMMEQLEEQLIQLGIHPEQIHSEAFAVQAITT